MDSMGTSNNALFFFHSSSSNGNLQRPTSRRERSPQKVVKSKGTPHPKWPKHSGLRIYFIICPAKVGGVYSQYNRRNFRDEWLPQNGQRISTVNCPPFSGWKFQWKPPRWTRLRVSRTVRKAPKKWSFRRWLGFRLFSRCFRCICRDVMFIAIYQHLSRGAN